MLFLGKKPARPDAVKLKFGAFFDAAQLPVPPKMFGHVRGGTDWGMLANDSCSDCVFAGAAHETMVWVSEGGQASVSFTDADVVDDYSAVTGYKPSDPLTDTGTDMQQAAEYRRKTGVVDSAGKRHTIDAYVALSAGKADDLALATYLSGASGVGLVLPDSALDQFDAQKPWTVVPGAKRVGGHYCPCVGRNSVGNFLVVTWGRLHAMTPAFYSTYCDEAMAYISLEAMTNKTTPEGFDAPMLARSLARLST